MMKKLSALLLLVILSVSMIVPAYAETVFKDGIEVMLTTDKENYDSFDVIDAKLTVKNTNSFDVENVSMEIKAPEGYMLTNEGETKIGELSAGEMQQQQTGMRDAEAPAPVLPQTGDNSHGMLWGLLFVVSSVAVCVLVIRHPQAKRIISLLLCVALFAPYMMEVAPALAQGELATEMIMVSKEVLVNGEKVELTGMVTYQAAELKAAEKTENTSAFGLKINETADSVKVREGDKLSFTGAISAAEGAVISAVQVFVYDATTEVPYTMGEKYYEAEGLNVAQFDLASVPEMTVGEAFGESDYAMTEGGRYAVMFYATDSKGNSFADMDLSISGNQGPVINVRVLMDPANCNHSAKEYVYERDEYTASRVTDSGDGLTHLVEDSYKRYCADCSAYLMNIWGSGASQEHTMADGVCTGCGYAAVPMMLSASRSLDKIEFESYSLGVLAGQTYYITWNENGGSDYYIVNVKLLSGEPAYNDNEEGTSLVLNSKRYYNYVWVEVPETAIEGQYIKVHVYGESDGVQTEAGNQLYLRVGCEHNYSSAETVEKYYPIEGDETHHQCVEYYTHKCSECGFVLEKTESDPVIGEHEFGSIGRCSLCRYEIELDCYHTYSNRTLLRSYYEQKNDLQHNLVDVYQVSCRDCGVLIYGNAPEYQPQNHEFNAAGECVQCNWNADSECQHYRDECTQLGNVTYSCEYLDEYEPIYHWVEQECVLSCADCGEVLYEDWTKSDLEPHDFNSDSTCRKCGYVGTDLIEDNTAPQILSFTSSVGTTVTIGQMPIYEAVVYDENLRCVELVTDDGWTLDSVMDPVSDTVHVSAWSFAGEVGTYMYKVIAVDYAGNAAEKELYITIVSDEIDCQHTDYTDHYNAAYPINYWEKDETSHYYQLGYDRICDDCGESWIVYSDPPLTAEHSFEDEACSLCGYTKHSDKVAPEIRTVRIKPDTGAVGTEVTYRAEVSDDVELFRYMLYINDSLADEGSLSGTEDVVEFSTTELPVGEYYFKLTVYDMAENEWSYTLSLPVEIVEKEESDCQHTPGETTYNRHVFAPFDEKQHQTTAIIWDVVCSTCGISYEDIDTEGDENNPVGLKYDHEWENGKCGTCEYECAHPEEDINGTENYRDEYLNSVSITDSKDGATHLHTYNVKRTCLACGDYWTEKLENVPEEHTIRDLDEKAEYDFDSEEHWKVVSYGCSCGYLEGDPVIKNKETHKLKLVKSEQHYASNGGGHDVSEIEYYACDCGFEDEPVWKLIGPSGHSDCDGDHLCDKCGETVDVYNEYNEYYSQHHYTDISDEDYDLIDEKIRQLARNLQNTDGFVDTFVEFVERAPYKERELLIATLDDIFGLYAQNDGGSYYYGPFAFWNEVVIDITNNTKEMPLDYVIFHELGHAVDDMAIDWYAGSVCDWYKNEEGKTLTDVIVDDVVMHIRENVGKNKYSEDEWDRVLAFIVGGNMNMEAKTITEVFPFDFTLNEVMLAKEIIEFYSGPIRFGSAGFEFSDRSKGYLSKSPALSDKFGGVTGNKLNGGYYHPDGEVIGEEDYWRTAGVLNSAPAKELWADYFSYGFRNDVEGLSYIEEALPNAYSMLEDMKNYIYEEITEK